MTDGRQLGPRVVALRDAAEGILDDAALISEPVRRLFTPAGWQPTPTLVNELAEVPA